MKIAYATYIDNQEAIGYPIEFLRSQIPDLKVYSSDINNQSILGKSGIYSVIIGHQIKTQSDIAVAQNKCLDNVFSCYEPDYVVWVQADTFISKEGFDIINRVCVEGNEDKSFALRVKHIRLFHLCHSDYFGVTIFGKNHKERFVADGGYTEHTGNTESSRLGSESATIDIGYLTIEQCRRHLAQHKKTWGNGRDFSEYNDKDFVAQYLRRNDVEYAIKKDSIYYDLICKMNLMAEYEQVKKLAFDVTLSPHGRMNMI